jgi:hypothetical protein
MAQLQAQTSKALTYHQAKRAKIATRSPSVEGLTRVSQDELAKFEFYDKGTYAWEFRPSRPGKEFLTLNLPEYLDEVSFHSFTLCDKSFCNLLISFSA